MKITVIYFSCLTIYSAAAHNNNIPWSPRNQMQSLKIQEEFHEKDSKLISGTSLINYAGYLEDVTQRFISALEEYDFSNLPFIDFNYNISRNYYGMELKGTVYFTKGFLASVKRIVFGKDIQFTLDENTNTASVYAPNITWVDTVTFHNFYADLTTTQIYGTAKAVTNRQEMELRITKDFNTMELIPEINLKSSNAPKWQLEPADDFTQGLTNSMSKDMVSNEFAQSFQTWTPHFYAIWPSILNSIPFPNICYNNCDK